MTTTSALPDNIWLGVSAEDQPRFDERWPLLRETPAAVHFISMEPLLGPIFFRPAKPAWVIIGGESGPGARACRLGWIRDIVAQCRAAGVPVFVKQLGADPRHELRAAAIDTGYPISDRKGGNIADFPEDLQVREFPR